MKPISIWIYLVAGCSAGKNDKAITEIFANSPQWCLELISASDFTVRRLCFVLYIPLKYACVLFHSIRSL